MYWWSIFVVVRFCQETIPCQPGFSSDNFVFTVHRERLQRGKILGRVDFDICTDQNRFLFICDDNRFKVEIDGTIKVKHDIKLHHGRINFSIHGWHSVGKKITSRVTTESQNIQMFPHPSSGLKRYNRQWVGHVFDIPENQRAPFPKELGPLTVHAAFINGTSAEDPMIVIVFVVDENDNNPEFISNTFIGNVNEGSQPGTSVMTVTATDKDDPTTDNGMFKFSVLSQTPPVPHPQMFTIDQDTGTIRVISAGLDRENVSEYTLIIKVADMKGTGLSNTATASITVLDQNDNAPQFNPTNYIQNVPENAVDFEVVRLIVTDNDERHTPTWNAKYRIVKGNDGGNFGITAEPDSNDGIVKTIKVSAVINSYCLDNYTRFCYLWHSSVKQVP
uniref:B-cadherin-like n=1 Tax=Erpetoichthys calabaricus TaxID=27687 RepID=A0A8C4SHV2_ERPCA